MNTNVNNAATETAVQETAVETTQVDGDTGAENAVEGTAETDEADFHFRLIVVWIPGFTDASSNQRAVTVFTCV